ncbi:MAG: Holliday junction branch migration protein RuvA [Gemmatimonadota bacterium]|nr:MAG: Holliday junction branch migration protein RuvA [Gemmatimonadota bacterium]
MISRVRGVLVHKEIDRAEIATRGGVTYELQIPLSVFEALPAVGEDVELFAALVAREDGLELFGFQGELERQLFLRLRSAAGIGPRLALTLLSAMSAGQLVEAIRGRDLGRLQMVSGVGRKKAERIAIELADKLEDMAVAAAVEPESALVESAVAALVALGYSRGEAEGAVRNVLRNRDGAELGLESVVREALAVLS